MSTTLKRRPSKVRPGKREAVAELLLSEGLADEVERRARIAKVDPCVMAERLLAFAAMNAPDDGPEDFE